MWSGTGSRIMMPCTAGRALSSLQHLFHFGLLRGTGQLDLAEVGADALAGLLDGARIAGAGIVVADAQHGQRRA